MFWDIVYFHSPASRSTPTINEKRGTEINNQHKACHHWGSSWETAMIRAASRGTSRSSGQ